VERNKIYIPKNVQKSMIIPGDPKGSPDDLISAVVFIDNAYLMRVKHHFFAQGIKYSIKKFVELLARRTGFDVRRIFLYDAPPFQSPLPSEDERRRKEKYDKVAFYLKGDGIVLREGRTQRIKVGEHFLYRQKGVDMLLGIDMVSIEKDFPNISNIILLSGDSDFVPVIEKLSKQNIKVILWTYFERNRLSPFSKSNYLIKKANARVKICRQDFEQARIE